MKLINLVLSTILSITLFDATASSKLRRRSHAKAAECKKFNEDCTHKLIGTDCCEDHTCDRLTFSISRQSWVYINFGNKNEGVCKLKQDKPCDSSMKDRLNVAPCESGYQCKLYLWQPEKGDHCIPSPKSIKVNDKPWTTEESDSDKAQRIEKKMKAIKYTK
jgi:hypothetical protein